MDCCLDRPHPTVHVLSQPDVLTMEETGEPAGIVSSLVMGAALEFLDFLFLQAPTLRTFGSRFTVAEMVGLGSTLGIAIHIFGKITR